ncbi:MAG: phosphatidylglycerophosphate synthase [Acidimicrobiaceae bacterium]|nr:phosphatidylglycerophosphate synthase [Acidimicrobiaceae bacterium]
MAGVDELAGGDATGSRVERPAAGLPDPSLAGSEQAAEQGLERILTVPNLLSVLRIGLLVGFAVLVLGEHERILGASLLAVAGVTDFLDGWVARRFHQVTTLGKMLDPMVDRLMLATAIVVIVVSGAVPIWLTVVVLGREALVAGAALVLAAKGARRIDVMFVGKAGTFGLMVCFPLLLAGHGPGTLARAVKIAASIGLVPALALSFAAAIAYVPQARRALAARGVPAAAEGDGAG